MCVHIIIIMIILWLQDLLTRVEEAVDRFLYWDEEITIIEAVTNVSYME